MKKEIIFSQDGYTVEKVDEVISENKYVKRIERYWIISDGTHSFTISDYRPELTIESIKKEMQEYLIERRDSLDNEIKEDI
jgi:hypothetical protein